MIEKHQVGLYLLKDTAFMRIQKSTVLPIAMNPQTESYDYISDESPTEELKKYKKSIDQDMTAIKGEPDYELIWDYYFNMKTGQKAKTEVMIVYFEMPGTLPNTFLAEKAECTISVTDYDAVTSKINFQIMFGGTVTQGTAALTLGVPTFTPNSVV